jgi:hypothetical protein
MEKSETITKLSAALVKFSGKMTKVGKDAVNPHFRNKYASLSNIIEGTQGDLAECGLAVLQLPAGENQLTTMLIHESGEYISETYVMRPTKNDPQGLGSAITYQRRYALGAILNLNIDEDDDGNGASKQPDKQPDKAPEKPKPPAKQPTQVDERPWLSEGTDAYNNIIAWLAAGNDFATVEKKYRISDEVKLSIDSAVDALSKSKQK